MLCFLGEVSCFWQKDTMRERHFYIIYDLLIALAFPFLFDFVVVASCCVMVFSNIADFKIAG